MPWPEILVSPEVGTFVGEETGICTRQSQRLASVKSRMREARAVQVRSDYVSQQKNVVDIVLKHLLNRWKVLAGGLIQFRHFSAESFNESNEVVVHAGW